MEWTIEWLDKPGYVRVALSGPYSLDDIPQMVSDIGSCEFWQPGRPLLIDDSGVDAVSCTTRDIEKMSEIFSRLDETFGASKVALVADSDLQYGLARQFQGLAEINTVAYIGVFRCEDDAVLWLGIPSIDN